MKLHQEIADSCNKLDQSETLLRTHTQLVCIVFSVSYQHLQAATSRAKSYGCSEDSTGKSLVYRIACQWCHVLYVPFTLAMKRIELISVFSLVASFFLYTSSFLQYLTSLFLVFYYRMTSKPQQQ